MAERCLKINVLDFRGSLAHIQHNLIGNEFVFVANGRKYRVHFADTEVDYALGDVPTEEKVSAILEGIAQRNNECMIALSCIGVPRTFPFAVRESEWADVNGRPWALYPDERELSCGTHLDKQGGEQTGEGNKM
jgi:hypothetical protein